jgi:hypothetical protein
MPRGLSAILLLFVNASLVCGQPADLRARVHQYVAARQRAIVGEGIVNFVNNQHGENENVRLGHVFRGMTTIAALLAM